MNTYVLVYNGFAQFEIIFTCLFMKEKGDIIVVGIDENEVKSIEGFIIKPTKQLKSLDINEIDLLVIPGGEAKNIYNNSYLDELLRKLNEKKKVIAAICAAPVKLAKAGILVNKKFVVDKSELKEFEEEFKNSFFVNENVVIDENIITAKPCGYMEFALEISEKMGIHENDSQIQETINFFKFYKDENN
jgi:putative intracellular protease/amidase